MHLSNSILFISIDDETRRLQNEVEAARKVQEEATAAIIAASIPNNIHVRENDDNEENDDLMMNGADLETSSSTDIPRPEEDRETAVSKKKDLQEQLKVCFLLFITLYNFVYRVSVGFFILQ